MPVVVTSNLPVIDISHALDLGVKIKMTPVTFPQIHFLFSKIKTMNGAASRGFVA